METTVYLVRHGMHDWLRPDIARLAGRRPGIPLNEQGRREAARVGAALAGRPLRWVAASPIQRTLETAEMIAHGREVDVLRDERLLEWGLGPWDGMGIAEIRRRYPEEWRTWRERPADLRLPGAETLEQVADRMEQACLEWMERGGEGVIVSHQDPLEALIARLIGMPLSSMRALDVRTGSVSMVRQSRHGIIVESVNIGVVFA